ncbi:NAD(P)/FAD-dependent oxidoreductase [Sulfuricurvum sp.]|uniref:NAD(P)/FAD-dependent oxidoreductase n=1 Tax=Sulfuricurvum sp. TaxID=2025608 RepID=UPI003567C0EC
MNHTVIESDILIIGGGPAGSVAAAHLAQKGYSVSIVEKVPFPRFVIGESLLPRCNEILEDNNMLEAVDKHGFTVKNGACFERDGALEIFNFQENIGQRFGNSYQVKREEFDNLLLEQACGFGAQLYPETEITAFDPETTTAQAIDKEGNALTFKARFALDASGYGRVFPRLLDLDTPSELEIRSAVFTRVRHDIRPVDETEGYIYIYVHGDNEAWIWTIPFSDGVTSVGVVCTEAFYASFGLDNESFWDRIIASTPGAKERFEQAEKIVPVGKIDGYSANVKSMVGKNYCMAGNATEFLDPVFSSGVTLALESGNKAAQMIDRTLKGESVDWESEYVDYMMKGINVFREFVAAWYDGRLQEIFFAEGKPDKIKRSFSSVLGGYVWEDQNMFVRNPKIGIDAVITQLRG